MKKKRHKFSNLSQAALEFLMSYGWAIMVVIVAIAALAYFGVLSPDKFIPERCIVEAGIDCLDYKVTDNFADIVIKNSKGEDISISDIDVGGCTGTTSGTLKNGEQRKFRLNGCNFYVNTKYSGDFNISYTGESGLQHKPKGNIITKVETSTAVTKTLKFREDGTSINTTNEAEIQAGNPNTNYGSMPSLTIDGQSPHAHAVIQFPNIIGNSAGQVSLGTQIDSATLTVNCFNTGNPANAYLLLEDWTESEVTWNQRKSGVSWGNVGADGAISRANNAVVWSCPWPNTGYINFDMTSFVQSWADGTANYGVVAIETGEDGTDFTTSEDPIIAEKPLLTVVYTDYQ